MPKKNKIDEEKKKEIEDLIEDLKENALDINKAEIEELEELLNEVLNMESEPFWKKAIRFMKGFSIHYLIMYLISVISFGLYFQALVLPNKLLLFFVGGIVSLILTVFEDVPRNPFRRHFIMINLMIFVIIVMGIYIINRDVYSVFNMSYTWIFYLITVVALYYMIGSSLGRRLGV